MKIVGLMCSRNGADLLPQVIPHVRPLVDAVYAYDDGSTDDTYSLLKDLDYVARRDAARETMGRGHYHHLLERVKKDFKGEDVWCVITMDDRFFLNQKPREIVALAGDNLAVEGVQLDFLRHRLDPWTKENDTFPDYSNIRNVCRWAKIDERCIVAFKLGDHLSYASAKYPWPQGLSKVQHGARSMNWKYSLDMPYLEHQGRRSPEHFRQSYLSGSRPISHKYKDKWDLSSWESTVESKGEFFAPYRVTPWIDAATSLPELVTAANLEGMKQKVARRYYYWGMEAAQKLVPAPPRRDV